LPPDVVPVPIVFPPNKKVTVSPLVTLGLTVAVNVTAAPNAEGFDDDATDVAVATLLTVCKSGLDVDAP